MDLGVWGSGEDLEEVQDGETIITISIHYIKGNVILFKHSSYFLY